MRAVDCEVHTQSAQSQKDCISIRLPGDGCGDEPFAAQVRNANEHILRFQLCTFARKNPHVCPLRVCKRIVCGALIGSESLEWERTQLWALTFRLIRKIIGGVDYKVFLSDARTSGIHRLNNFKIIHPFWTNNCLICLFAFFSGHSRPPENNPGQNPDHSYSCQLGHCPAASGCQGGASLYSRKSFCFCCDCFIWKKNQFCQYISG